MEDFYGVIIVVAFIFGILQIILFFKIWGMTNDASRIKDILEMILRKELQQKRPLSSILTNSEQGWGKDVTEEDKKKAQSIIYNLKDGEIIIKLLKNNRIIVYNIVDLHELENEEYQVIYF